MHSNRCLQGSMRACQNFHLFTIFSVGITFLKVTAQICWKWSKTHLSLFRIWWAFKCFDFTFPLAFLRRLKRQNLSTAKVYFSVSNPLLCNCWLWPRTMCALLILGLNTEIWNNSTIIQHIYDLKLNEERKEKEEMLFELDYKLLILKYYWCGTFLHFQHWSIWDIYFEMGKVEYLDLTLSVRWYCGRLYVLIQATLIALWEGQYKMIQITIQSVYIFQQNVIERPQLPLLQLAR